MSCTTTITIEAAEKEWLPCPTTIAQRFDEWTDYSFNDFDSSTDDKLGDNESPVRVITREGWSYTFGYVRNWTTLTVHEFGLKLSAQFPGCYVEIEEEWNSEHADEPGHEKKIYAAGRIHKRFASLLVEINEKGEPIHG